MEMERPSWKSHLQLMLHLSNWRQIWHQMIVCVDFSSLYSWQHSYDYHEVHFFSAPIMSQWVEGRSLWCKETGSWGVYVVWHNRFLSLWISARYFQKQVLTPMSSLIYQQNLTCSPPHKKEVFLNQFCRGGWNEYYGLSGLSALIEFTQRCMIILERFFNKVLY
jgi:hypothetical protein